MKNALIGAATLAVVLVLGVSAQADMTFIDDFNRSDSTSVGNGWSEGLNDDFTGLIVQNSKLSGSGLIHRSLDFAYPVRIRATLRPGGCGDAPANYSAIFTINSDATDPFQGYGVLIDRGGRGDDVPRVCRLNNGDADNCQEGFTDATRQWSGELEINLVIFENGVMNVDVARTNGVSGFGFAVTAIPRTGNRLQVGILNACPGDPSTIDDLVVEGEAHRTPTATPLDDRPSQTRTRTASGGSATATPQGIPGTGGGGGGGCSVVLAATNTQSVFLLLLPLAMILHRKYLLK